jgi:hypothetical protein
MRLSQVAMAVRSIPRGAGIAWDLAILVEQQSMK